MHLTFFRLFLNSRGLGSNIGLPLAILASSVLALLFTLPICSALGIPLDPIQLSEALPFIVCTVGFDKPLRLARAVFTHPEMARDPLTGGVAKRTPVRAAGDVVIEAVDEVWNPVVRDYVLEIVVLLFGAYSRVGGLRDLCAFAAILLAVDALASITFYVAVLSVMVEVSFSCFGQIRFVSSGSEGRPCLRAHRSLYDDDCDVHDSHHDWV
jgi:hydroxymethylglutaryl-CoA reductase (NADPH)